MTQDRIEQSADEDFRARQRAAQERINELDKDGMHDETGRAAFFNQVYAQAGSDAANIPWADLAPKPQLTDWLAANSAHSGRAIDVACGLGDHAEALAKAGYDTTAFDNAEDAIRWAKKRFPDSSVTYKTADLFDLPQAWQGSFDLVWECYTMQAMPPETLVKSQPAIASLVKPGGILLVYTRVREDGVQVEGPPWPLEKTASHWFGENGFERVSQEEFTLEKNDRSIPHYFTQWKKIT